MDNITTTLKQDWFVIEEKINNAENLISLFKPSPVELDKIITGLKNSVIEGIFEYKKSSIISILRPLESFQYDSRAASLLPEEIEKSKALLLVTLLQRLFCTKKLTSSASVPSGEGTARNPEAMKERDTPVNIKEILEYVRNEVKSDPEKMKSTEIKKIIMYSKMYQNEIKKMKDLAVNIPADKKKSLQENFNTSLKEITTKLNTAYKILTEGSAETPEAIPQAHLNRYDYTSLAPALKTQGKAFSEILSTLSFAEKEKFHTRQLLINLTGKKEKLIKLIDLEQAKYQEIDPFDKNGLKASMEFSGEIIKFLKKEKEWLKFHPWR